jgi:hypothetical protein
VTFEFRVTRQEMRAWMRLMARRSGKALRDMRRLQPPLAVDGRAYRRRQRNRVKRGRR